MLLDLATSGMIRLMIVIRFVFFLFGICLGMAAAIAALPLPGKTFFNRMSKLPRGARSLIDNGIDLSISITQLVATCARELGTKSTEIAELTKEKFAQIKRSIEIEKLESESMKYAEKLKDSQKEVEV